MTRMAHVICVTIVTRVIVFLYDMEGPCAHVAHVTRMVWEWRMVG